MDMTECVLCRDKTASMAWAKLITRGIRTPIECAAYYGISPEDVNDHLNNHIMYKNEEGRMDSPDYVVSKVLKIVEAMDEFFDEMRIQDTTIDRSTMDLILRLSKELRESLKLLADLQGRLGNSNETRVIEITNNYKMLTQVIMTEMCGDCQMKVIDAMDRLQLTSGAS